MEKQESKTDRQERIPHFRQDVVRRARVAVFGAGATGNEVLKCLALTGVGYVFVADMDVVTTSNLSRTVLFCADDVGKPKAPLAAERFCGMNMEDTAAADFFTGDLCTDLGEGVLRRCDVAIGCLDNDRARLAVAGACRLLGKPYVDIGIRGFGWNVGVFSGRASAPCFACTLSARQERRAAAGARSSCDVIRRIAAAAGVIPTIGISAAAAAALAVQEVIKILHHQQDPGSGLPAPRCGWLHCFSAQENELRRVRIPVRGDCTHACYDRVTETPLAADWTLQDALAWVHSAYGKSYALALYKDEGRGFVTRARCKSCGAPIKIYRSLPLDDTDLLCAPCRKANRLPQLPSDAEVQCFFGPDCGAEILALPLAALGLPPLHVLEFAPVDETGGSLFLEMTGDLAAVLPHLPH